MLKIRRPLGRLIFNMGNAIPGKTVFLIETAPWVFRTILTQEYGHRLLLWYPTLWKIFPVESDDFKGRSYAVYVRSTHWSNLVLPEILSATYCDPELLGYSASLNAKLIVHQHMSQWTLGLMQHTCICDPSLTGENDHFSIVHNISPWRYTKALFISGGKSTKISH